MIAKLRGIIDFIGENHTIIDISGVGYLVHCPSKVINKLSPIGQIDELLIETIVREDQFTLYGFKDEKEKAEFRDRLFIENVWVFRGVDSGTEEFRHDFDLFRNSRKATLDSFM